jgi:peptidoglycan-N-acetylglucosamine deacetylase
MRLFRPCLIAGWLYPGALFRIQTDEKLLFLTFDDGPDPDSTPHLLDLLETYDIKALFFCVGSASEKYPDLISRIKKNGHVIGNHGFSHLSGWRTGKKRYLSDISRAAQFTSPAFFRPPFGHLNLSQFRKLKKTFKIVFWDIMAYDFDPSFGNQNSLRILKTKLRPGSIIVLHDTVYSSANTILGEFITYSLKEGYRFELLDIGSDK